MKKIKYILSLFLLTITQIVYSQATSPYYVRVLHVLNGESVIDSYILPSELDSITFSKIQFYKVSATSLSEDMGSVTLSKDLVRQGESVTMTASEKVPYRFKNWILNGVEVSEENPYTTIVTDNSDFIANYEYDPSSGRNSVDLGLSVKWATCNLGANSPEQEGDHFMWGETFPRTYFGNMIDDTNTYTDNPSVLPLSADAANAIWKGDWRMPTKEECEELVANCKWELTTLYGVELLSATSKINGNKIYMPIPGCGIQGSEIYYPGDSGWYLTSTNNLDSPENSYALYVARSVLPIAITGVADKNWAFVIRPVLPYE